MRIHLSLCRIKNHDALNCHGFDLTIYNLLGFYIDLSIHKASKTLRVNSKYFMVWFDSPSYLRIRRS